MKRILKFALLLLMSSLSLQGCNDDPSVASQTKYQISISEIVVEGLNRPLAVINADDGSDRLFIVEQGGLIKVVENGMLLDQPFLDIQSLISTGSEQGLLGLAFHPEYAKNGQIYINFTDIQGATNIVQFTVSKDPNNIDSNSAFEIMRIPQPYANHNGGYLAFGPDGYLYIGMGDGGSSNDPQNNAQDLSTPLGKMLRVDVDGEKPYAIPNDNPFIDVTDADPRIWDYGLRNPWRFSFDRLTGDLYIGDVGQNRWEEVNFSATQSSGGLNFGWVCKEATHENQNRPSCSDSVTRKSFIDPIAEYGHRDGQSIVGGYVYRGMEYPAIHGIYFFADFGSGKIWSIQLLDRENNSWSYPQLEFAGTFNISSFGEDENGELYIVDYSGGSVRKLTVK